MIVEQVYCHRTGWHWLAQGDGYDYPIAAEGKTREEAVEGWASLFGQQYAKAQTETHISEVMYGDCP